MSNARSVLIVDDDVQTLQLMRTFLQRYGVEVLVAAHGAEALQVLQDLDQNIGVVLLDLAMPEISGMQVAAFIRGNERLSKLPIIVLTARTDIETRQQAFDAGVNEVLTKPFGLGEIEHLLRGFGLIV